MVMLPRFLRLIKRTQYKFLEDHLFRRSNFLRYKSNRAFLNMDKVYLRYNENEDERLNINFRYINEELKVDRDFNFSRNINEKVDDFLVRIRTNVEKELNKRLKKGKKKSPAQVPEPLPDAVQINGEIPVEILHGDDKITDITFAELLNTDKFNELKLRVIDKTFQISYNEPWVTNLVLPGSILAGFLVYPSKVELQFANKNYSKCMWFKAKMPASGDIQRVTDWSECGKEFFYDCKNDDIGHHLKLVFTPGNEMNSYGPPVEQISKKEVQAGPGPCPFEIRHCFTKERLKGNVFRVVSYNLLADLYADSDYSRTQLFPYCPTYALRIDYRKQLFLKELLGYNADIMCLQEVDVRLFDSDLKTVFETPELAFSGLMAPKGTCGEGLAVFYRNDRFELVESRAINIGEGITTLPELEDLSKKIKHNEPLWQRICDRSTTLQIVLLKSKENDRYLLIANTHLYFHPDADHIRLLQIGFSMCYIEHYYHKALENLQLKTEDEHKISLIFCGDFNSVPECGIYKLLTERFVDKDCIDWSSNQDEAVKNVTLSQPFQLKSACGTPKYTNYTQGFADCLDYIFYQSDRLEVEQVIPLPTEEELSANGAIPSVVFPSDHVSLVADLKFSKI